MSVLAQETRGRTGGSAGLAWSLVLGIVLAALNLRTAVTSVGPVLDQLSSGLGMSGVGVGLLTTLPVLIFATVGAVTPALSRQVGEHRLLLLALVILGAGLLSARWWPRPRCSCTAARWRCPAARWATCSSPA